MVEICYRTELSMGKGAKGGRIVDIQEKVGGKGFRIPPFFLPR